MQAEPVNTAKPRWMTPRRPERPTRGPVIAKVAEMLGFPLKLWQRAVADVIGEYDPVTGLHYYSTVIITGPRQIGKTSIFLPIAVARCLFYGPNQQVMYTCQDRNHAYKKFMDEQVAVIQASPKFKEGKDYTIRRTNGQERVKWERTQSSQMISAVKETSGHGGSLDLVNVDEAFAHQDTSIDSSFSVPMQARTMSPHLGPQMFIMSTKGANSPYLDSKIDVGRKAVEKDLGEGVFFCEFSADPSTKGFDPYDESMWWKTHPTLGDLLGLKFMRDQATVLSQEDFCRAYLNIKPEGKKLNLAIELTPWTDCLVADSEILGTPSIAVDLPPNESDDSCIVAAGLNPSDKWLLDVIDSRPGDDWIIDRLRQLRERHGIGAVTLEQGSRSGALVPDLLAAGWEVDALPLRKIKEAAGALRLSVHAGEVSHLGHMDLDLAVSNAGQIIKGEGGGWRFGKALSGGPSISTLVAASMALSAAKLKQEEQQGQPSVYESGGFVDLSDYMQ